MIHGALALHTYKVESMKSRLKNSKSCNYTTEVPN